MNTELQKLMKVLDAARDRGARASEVYVVEETGFDCEVQRGKVVSSGRTDSAELTVRVWLEGGRHAEASGTPDAWSKSLDKALKKAEKAAEDEHAGPAERLSAPAGGLGIDDQRWEDIDDETRIEVAVTNERAARKEDRKVETGPFTYRDRRTRRALVNSRDVAMEEWGTRYTVRGAIAVPDLGLSTDHIIDTRAYAAVGALPFGVAEARRLLQFTRPVDVPKGPHRLLLPPRFMCALFRRLAEPFSYQGLASGKTFWSKAKPEEPFLDPQLHLLDDGSMPGALRTRAFDDRGVPPVPLTLLREGIVDKRFLDLATARELGTRPTGHERDGKLQPSNLMLRGGSRSMTAILSDVGGQGLLIEHVYDWDGLDLATGDLTFTCAGIVREGSDELGNFRDVTIRGNLIDCFNQVVDISSDTDRVEHVDAPGILCDGFEVV